MNHKDKKNKTAYYITFKIFNYLYVINLLKSPFIRLLLPD